MTVSLINGNKVVYTINMYRGCSHECIYCFARGEYYKIPNFSQVQVKKDALRLISDDLRKCNRGIVATGGLSDPYNPGERELMLTRNAIKLVNDFHLGICIVTKSDMVVRDIDILQAIKTHSPVNVCFTITCAEDEMCKTIEPFAPAGSQRFAAIKELTREGIPAGVLIDPVLPYINDTEANVRGIVKKAKEAGAQYIYASMGVTLEDSQREYFFKKAEIYFPGTMDTYNNRFGNSCYCRSPHENGLLAAFAEECERQGLVYDVHRDDMITRDAKVFASILMNLSQIV